MQARSLSTPLLAAWLAIALAVGGCGERTPAPPPERAARVVSLVPALTEIVVALDGADALVGIGAYDDPVPGRDDLPRLGDALSVSLETVSALEPDVVLVNGEQLRERLAPIAHDVAVVTLPTDRLADVDATIERLGELLGRRTEAWRLAVRIDAAVAAARARARTRRDDVPPRVLVVVQRRPTYVAGETSSIGELLAVIGAVNAAEGVDGAWPVLSDESLLARRPDVILDASIGESDNAEGRLRLTAAWAEHPEIPAVAAGRVHFLGKAEEALFRPGPRLPEAIALLERLVFGESEDE